LAADAVTPNEQTSEYMAAHGCHFIVCSLCILKFIIEICSFTAHDRSARTALYKTGPLVLSRVFLVRHEKHQKNPFVLCVPFCG